MLEKIMAIATAKDLHALYEQGTIFAILLVLSVLIYALITYLKPKYQKKAITQYKNNIYNYLLEKSISDFNKRNISIEFKRFIIFLSSYNKDFDQRIFNIKIMCQFYNFKGAIRSSNK